MLPLPDKSKPMTQVIPNVKLSEHFSLSEFEHGDPIPDELIPIFRGMCVDLLEPIRERFEFPLVIHSGYRSPEHNAAVGGAPTSQHIATEQHCACDFVCPYLSVVFDWIRLRSDIPFDQVILEREIETGEPACIHISYAKEFRRMALAGLTHGRGGYTHLPVGTASVSMTTDLWGEA